VGNFGNNNRISFSKMAMLCEIRKLFEEDEMCRRLVVSKLMSGNVVLSKEVVGSFYEGEFQSYRFPGTYSKRIEVTEDYIEILSSFR